MSKRQKFLLISSIIVGLAGLLAVVWYVWSTQLKLADETDQSSQAVKVTEYKNITVNGYTFKYPLSDNNRQVILEESGNIASPVVVYAPVRNYFVGSNDKACQAANAGLLQADRIENLFGPSNPYGSLATTEQKQAKVDSLIKDGRAVKLGDIYVLAPSKQNEPCAELAKPKDGKLQIALFEAQAIQKDWLQSLEIVH